MSGQKPKRITLLLPLYLLVSIVGFSIVILGWTYQTSIQAINLELESSFDQKHTFAETIMEQQLEFVINSLQDIQLNEKFLTKVSQKNKKGTEDELLSILDSNPDGQLDILFVGLQKGKIFVDVSSPFFDTESILPEIFKKKTSLLTAGHILRIKNESVDLTMMLRAVPILQKKTGRVLGMLFGGIVLNDNLYILESIKRKTKSTLVVFFENNDLIGSTDLLESQATQTIQRSIHDHKKSLVHSSDGMLARFKNMSLSGEPTSLGIVTAITDQALTDLQHSYLKKGSILMVFSLIYILFTILIIRKLTFPSLSKLIQYSTDVSTGSLQARYSSGGIVEFNQLGEMIEQMVIKIQIEIEERRLAESERARLTTILETTSDLVSMATPDAQIIYLNSAGRAMIGLKDDKDSSSLKIANIHPDWALQLLDAEGIPQAIDNGLWEGETAIMGSNGHEIPVSQVIMSHTSPDGEFEYLSTIMRDMTERNHAETIANEARLLAQEMELARSIQTGLLPISIKNIHPDFEIAASMMTADQVGGDYYDITFDKSGNLWISIGDVSGHGVKPGLIMMMAQTIYTAVTLSKNCEARDAVIMVNTILFRNVKKRLNENYFMTFNALKYCGNGEFEHAGAHLRIIIYRRRTNQCELVSTKGVYLNLKEDISKPTINSYFEMETEDIMVLYTDGLTEAANREGELLDTEGLIALVIKHAHLKTEVMKDRIMDDVMKWCYNKRDDDLTLLIVKKKGELHG
ncbi:MAG: SpoIIE family protein phosphatase [Desulfobulbaceae bacterium]|nr:SpoIIE family protein phosphatase [Desulfobulbaceae bacterium]